MSVTKRKNKVGYSWQVQVSYKENGTYKRYTKSGFKTKKEALFHEAEINKQLNDKGTITKRPDKTLNEVYEEFLQVGASDYQPQTIYSTTRYYEYFKDELGHLKVKAISYSLLQQYFNSRSDQGIESNKQIKKAMSRIFKYAAKCEYIDTNPLHHVNVIGQEKHLDHDDIIELRDMLSLVEELDNINSFKMSAYAMAIKIAYYTGLRISEVLALEKQDFDFHNHLITIQRKLVIRDTRSLKPKEYYTIEKMKSKSSKAVIPLANVLLEDLEAWFQRNPYERVCCDEEGIYLNPNCLSNKAREIAKAKGFHFHFHALRHSFCTALVKAGVDLKTAQELMRHSNINTTISVYTHINQQQKIDAVNDVFKPICNKFATTAESKRKSLN